MTQAQVVHRVEPRGIQAQDLAALGAQLAGHGYTQQQVTGLLARVQKVAEQSTMMSTSEILEDLSNIQRARLVRLMGLIQAMPDKLGYISRSAVLMAIGSVMNEIPRQ